jgi:hypothetical protein
MLASACSADPTTMAELAAHRRRSDVKTALRWMHEQFLTARSAAARRVSEHVADEAGGEWAVEVARRFAAALYEAHERR